MLTLFAPFLQPIRLFSPLLALKQKTTKPTPNASLLVQTLRLLPLHSPSQRSRASNHCPSSPSCSSAARCRRSSRLLVLSQSPLPLHSLSTGTAVLLGLSCPLPSRCHLSCSVSGSFAGTTPFFSGKS